MAKKKMCKLMKEPDIKLQRMYCHHFMERKCPSNTTSKCEIVQPRKKDKVIKAWVAIRQGRPILVDSVKTACSTIPCTITISAKYWDKIKGDK